MQVADYTRYYPLLLGSDVLSLSSRFVLRDTTLDDYILGARHRLQPQGHEIIAAILGGIRLKDLESQARHSHISSRQLDEIIGFLNFTGALKLQRARSKIVRTLFMRIHGHVLHISYGILSRRNKATPLPVAQGLFQATWPVLVSSPFAAVLIWLSGIAGAVHWGHTAVWWIISFFVSFYLHELAHIAVVRRAGIKCDIFQRGMRFGIVHKPLSRQMEIISSLAGPAVGIGTCILLGVAGHAADSHMYGYMPGIIAAFHACSLLPWYGDGKSLYTNVNPAREAL